MVHYGHSCLVPVDQTTNIKMLYIFVDIKIDSLHFVENLKLSLEKEEQKQAQASSKPTTRRQGGKRAAVRRPLPW